MLLLLIRCQYNSPYNTTTIITNTTVNANARSRDNSNIYKELMQQCL